MAIFVDGCFWHGCKKCYKEPTSNVGFWKNKITKNKLRRIKVKRKLRKDNWKIIELWEHEIINNPEKIESMIEKIKSKS